MRKGRFLTFIIQCAFCIGVFCTVPVVYAATARYSGGAVTTKTDARARNNNVARSAIKASRQTTNASDTKSNVDARSVSGRIVARPERVANVIARATTLPSQTFGTAYNNCRDAYFTCMDQFCAQQNDSYRRCVCSSRLSDIQARENVLSKTSDSLQDFGNLNISVMTKTKPEVQAMLSASTGEVAAAYARDKSAAAKELSGISAVLANTKSNALSTSGKVDIGGDIKTIWLTTDLAGGDSIANLTGEKLYNAVNGQCIELVRATCGSDSTLAMVASAYGMYIENDCSALANALDKKIVAANAAVRDAEKQMHVARLENYNNHNSTPINDCVANVRADITMDTACGTDYIHCLDMTGKYLNYETGEPIYTAQFYQLADMISLDGDILNNYRNHNIVADLERRRPYAARSLDSCRDIADVVWDEFVRQAITEIYQGQQARIRQVKNECLDVVNQCYDEQNQQLKDFSNVNEQLLLGARLELSEQMCRVKMETCSNLYGGGEDGLHELLIAMHDIVDQRIARDCLTTLQSYVHDLCDVSSTNTTHKYPYSCRTYSPGSEQFASTPECNGGGGTCDSDYMGSLYRKIVEYAKQACVRPSAAEVSGYILPTSVIADINYVMDSVKLAMASELSPECEALGGYWVGAAWVDTETYLTTGTGVSGDNSGIESADGYHDTTSHTLLSRFYLEVGASPNWGYCADPDSLDNYTNYNSNSRFWRRRIDLDNLQLMEIGDIRIGPIQAGP